MPIYFPTVEQTLRSQLLMTVSAYGILVHVVPTTPKPSRDITQVRRPKTHLDYQHFVGPGPYRFYIPLKVGYRALHRIAARWMDQGITDITQVQFEPGAERWVEFEKLVVNELLPEMQTGTGAKSSVPIWPFGQPIRRDEKKEEDNEIIEEEPSTPRPKRKGDAQEKGGAKKGKGSNY